MEPDNLALVVAAAINELAHVAAYNVKGYTISRSHVLTHSVTAHTHTQSKQSTHTHIHQY